MDEEGFQPQDAETFVAPATGNSEVSGRELAEKQLYDTYEYIDEALPAAIAGVDQSLTEEDVSDSEKRIHIFKATKELLENAGLTVDPTLQDIVDQRIEDRIKELSPAVRLIRGAKEINGREASTITHLTPVLADELLKKSFVTSHKEKDTDPYGLRSSWDPAPLPKKVEGYIDLSNLVDLDDRTAAILANWDKSELRFNEETEDIVRKFRQ